MRADLGRWLGWGGHQLVLVNIWPWSNIQVRTEDEDLQTESNENRAPAWSQDSEVEYRWEIIVQIKDLLASTGMTRTFVSHGFGIHWFPTYRKKLIWKLVSGCDITEANDSWTQTQRHFSVVCPRSGCTEGAFWKWLHTSKLYSARGGNLPWVTVNRYNSKLSSVRTR